MPVRRRTPEFGSPSAVRGSVLIATVWLGFYALLLGYGLAISAHSGSQVAAAGADASVVLSADRKP